MTSRRTLWPSFVYLAIAGVLLLLPDPGGLNPVVWAIVAVVIGDLLWRIWKNWSAQRREQRIGEGHV